MGINRNRPHVFILPEDDANRQLANGFALEIDRRQVRVLNEAGGWLNVCAKFEKDHLHEMRNFPERSIILLIDFDNDPSRHKHVSKKIPSDLTHRVFVIGTWIEPESVKRNLRMTYEEIGRSIGRDCRSQDRGILQNDLLKHNLEEIDRICTTIAAIS